MLRIAVIDDDKTLLCDMHKLFDRFIIAYDFDFIVEYFSSCEDIYVKFKAGEKYDLLFLDIEFPEMKGTEFGLQLRRQIMIRKLFLFLRFGIMPWNYSRFDRLLS